MTLINRLFPNHKIAPQTEQLVQPPESHLLDLNSLETITKSPQNPTIMESQLLNTNRKGTDPTVKSIKVKHHPLITSHPPSSSSPPPMREPFFSPLKIQITNPFNQTTDLTAFRTDEQVIRKGETKNKITTNRIHSPSSASLLSHHDFETIRVIGQGSSGQVLLVKHKATGRVLAMKKMSKSHLLKKNKANQVRLERDVLIHSSNPWIVDLVYSFQDTYFVYLLLEYMPGGDLMTWLINKNIFTEAETRFYVAELVLAVESVHKMNLVHRDIKPDNILLDRNGHLKLTDFGLCKSYNDSLNTPEAIASDCLTEEENSIEQRTKNLSQNKHHHYHTNGLLNSWKQYRKNRQLLYSTVGSPGYIAPEVLLKKGYGFECDWWSVGVIMYEMLYGITPFFDENPVMILQKTIQWSKFLRFPRSSNVSRKAVNLMKHFLCDISERLGSEQNGGISAIKNHPFFEGIEWETIRQQQAPFEPELESETDSKYFDDFSNCPDPSPITPFGDVGTFENFSFKRNR